MKRVFICGTLNFPRGGASSNYVQYFGMALRDIGYEVHIVSTKNSEYEEDSYKGMAIDAVAYRSGKFRHYYDFRTGLKSQILERLKKYNISPDDVIMVYSHNLLLHMEMQKFCKNRGAAAGAIVVELFSHANFKHGRMGSEYWMYRRLNRHVIPKADFILPISTYIKEAFSGSPALQMVLPILADPDEFPYDSKHAGPQRNFIFPAMGKMKDALENMVLAIGKILSEPNGNIAFHFCGVSEHTIKKILKLPAERELDPRIILHGWMEYAKLIELYKTMHFLLLPREISQMTKANFPSKVPELMCYGVIPIASRVGDYTEYYLEHRKNSIIMDGCEVGTIVSAIEEAIDLDDLKICEMSCEARKLVSETLAYSVWTGRIREFMRVIHETKN